ncbi:efflux RND transporter periplasmic adaptor subunit [Martelella alba]|nr:efflux RND transporter periplasmic adaptor subunit [Martelella alba]
MVEQPDLVDHIRLALTSQQPSTAITHGQENETGPSSSAKNADAATQQRIQPPATGEIAGSGFVVAPRSTVVYSKYEGTVTGISVEVGDRVIAGQILVTIDNATAHLSLEQAEAARVSDVITLRGKKIALEEASASLNRYRLLAKGNVVSAKELEEAEIAWRTAQNVVDQATQAIRQADLAVEKARQHIEALVVRAPFAGTVTQLNAHLGDRVLARADSVRESQSLLTIADTTSMVIDADVAEANLDRLRSGLAGEAVLDGLPDHPFPVELQKIAPVASLEKGTIGLRLSLINPPDGIRPQMAARIRITIPQSKSASGELTP